MNDNDVLHNTRHDKTYYILLIMGIVFIGINLRGAITSVGPLVGMIRDDIGFSNWSVAFLTSLPLIAFAIMSPVAPHIARRFSSELAIVFGLLLLMLGISLRSISVIFLLFIGTLFVGLGIAICNVLLPSIIKENFPFKVGIMTSIYSISMGIFASTASGVSVPLAVNLNMGWQLSLLVWALPAIIAIVIWLIIYKRNNKTNERDNEYTKAEKSGMWKSTLAWKIALFMGFQSLIFYVTISWLPEMLMSFGMKQATAGYMLSYFQIVGIPASFIIPIIASKLQSQRKLVVIVNTLYLVGMLLLLMNYSFVTTTIAITFIGFASNSNFALALSFLAMRAKTAKHAAELSGMAQTIGYIIAATGPIFIGFIFDLSNVWTVPILILIGITFIILYFGLSAGKNEYVLNSE